MFTFWALKALGLNSFDEFTDVLPPTDHSFCSDRLLEVTAWVGWVCPVGFLEYLCQVTEGFLVFFLPQRMSPPSPLTVLAERVVAVDVVCKQCCTFCH